MATSEILTIKEVAELLRIGEKTAHTMAKEGALPRFKVGGQWRFRRVDIDTWIQDRVRQEGRGTNPAGSDPPGRK